MNELLKAIAARLTVALEFIEKGDIAEAVKLLRKLVRNMPVPDERHIQASQEILNEVER